MILLGQTDLEFLVEWCAEKAGLSFQREADVDAPACDGDPLAFVIAGEAVRETAAPGEESWDLHLAELVVRSRDNLAR